MVKSHNAVQTVAVTIISYKLLSDHLVHTTLYRDGSSLFPFGLYKPLASLLATIYAAAMCIYSGANLIRTPLGPSAGGWIIAVSSSQGLLIEHGVAYP